MNILKKSFQDRVLLIAGRGMIPPFLALMLITSSGCAGGQSLTAVQVQGIGDAAGSYTLTLYHEAQYGGLKTMAFLVPEGNGYSLAPYAPDYAYTTINNIGGRKGSNGPLRLSAIIPPIRIMKYARY